ncbi:MAG: pantoate--beta-alanine ligase [Leptospirales bacterium]
MQTVKTIHEMKSISAQHRCNFPDKKITLVPTMGFLHEGHLSLIRIAKKKDNFVIVSIFVNPIQFNDPADLEKYPRDETSDIEKLNASGVDLLFIPTTLDVYPDGPPDIRIDYPEITNKLCGKKRVGHFSGVLTVVHNLFQWVKPHEAIFGQKDYQQLLLIRKMSTELNMDVKVVNGPTIREADGLAMSSRNSRLSDEGRQKAINIHKALKAGWNLHRNNKTLSAAHILEQIIDILQQATIEIEYIGLYNPETLAELDLAKPVPKALVACAVFVDGVRLIDNILLD